MVKWKTKKHLLELNWSSLRRPNIAQKNADALNCEKRNATLPDKERFITRDEAARLLHVDLSTLWRWNKAGILRSKKVGQRRVMYKYSDVLDLLDGKAYGQKD